MAIPDSHRPLRSIQILALIPTIALTVPTSVLFEHAYFACISIPCIFSAILALILLHPRAQTPRWLPLLDAALACILICMLVPYWVGIGEGWGHHWRYSIASAILGTFGSFFPLLDFCIHCWFALAPAYPLVAAYVQASFGTRTCPHCQREISTTDPRLLWDLTPGASGRSSMMEHDSKTGYSPVATAAPVDEAAAEAQDGGETPRPSTDDETARLVES